MPRTIHMTSQLECHELVQVLRSGDHELRVLRGIDLAVEAGEFLAIVGPSGSGKSTLLGLLAGLDRPTAGRIRFEGRELGELDEDELALWRRSQVGFVFQSFQLLGNLTARENVLLPLELAGVEDPAARATEVLSEVGLEDRAGHYPSQLSGGEQQRVALARAFGPRPAILVADEPMGNLDRATGQAALELLLRLRDEYGTTLVLITHDEALAARADRRVRLVGGELVEAADGAGG